jgi:rhodanese-related sulfurtransferase
VKEGKYMFGGIFNSMTFKINKKNKFNLNYNRSSFRNNIFRSRSSFNYKLVTFEQARTMIENNKLLLIDVRTSEEYNLMHIKNALNIPLNVIEKEIIKYDINQDFMIYCTSGTRSKSAIQLLNNLGYNNIYIWEYAALSNFPYKDMIVYKNML